MYLVCREFISILKKYNIKQYYDSKHKLKYEDVGDNLLNQLIRKTKTYYQYISLALDESSDIVYSQ